MGLVFRAGVHVGSAGAVVNVMWLSGGMDGDLGRLCPFGMVRFTVAAVAALTV